MPFEPSLATGWRASLALAFERRGERTVLAERRHDGPLVVQKALYPEGGQTCHAIVVHPPASIAGGDCLDIAIDARERSHALLTTPGAAKWYRSAGAWARSRTTLAVGPGAIVEWLPQESIVFDGALADLRWEARLREGARLVAWDIACLGRTASGERFTAGRYRIDARLYRDERLAWIERGDLAPGSAATDSAAGLGARTVWGTMVAASPAIDAAWLAAAREVRAREGESAVTRLPGLLVARYRGDSCEAAREYFQSLWHCWREPMLAVAPVEPRIWRT